MHNSRTVSRFVLTAILGVLMTGAASSLSADEKKAERPKVEVVFCLDTTGSMGGLIEGAKQKIWAISNQILSGKPVPELKIGLVAYRDRTDAYVTQVFDLTDDLDAIHANLKKFKAQGGGDTPESVNQALNESVTKIKWSKDDKTLKIIFLVGDAPPHTDYKDDVQFAESCKLAVKSNIIINAVQCGNNAQCTKFWQEISRKSEGEFVRIAQDGGVVAIATPFDKDLGKLNSKLADTTVVFGDESERRLNRARKEEAKALPTGAAADRAGASGKAGRVATYDLIDAINSKKVKLKDLEDKQLPEKLRKMKPDERESYLKKVEQERKDINKKILDLDKKRSDYIKKELAKKKLGGKNAFDGQVLDMLRKQAKKHNIKY